MAIQLVIDYYNKNSIDLANKYESLSFEKVHYSAMPFLPEPPAKVLDIGAGSGRDAAWLNKRGYKVTAVEPASKLLNLAITTHGDNIEWVCDSLPGLSSLSTNARFDIILLSGVWMHIQPDERKAVLLKLEELCSESGIIVLSLRYGTLDDDRPMYEVSYLELEKLIKGLSLQVIHRERSQDRLSRSDISWESIILKKGNGGSI